MDYQTERRYHMTAAEVAAFKIVGADTAKCAPGEVRWSGTHSIPALGDIVFVDMNDFGWCEVRGYFIETDFLGLYCQPQKPPKWWLKQNPERRDCMIFGAEIDFAKQRTGA